MRCMSPVTSPRGCLVALAVSVGLLAGWPGHALAQGGAASIVGRVSDATGAAQAGATVTATNLDTGLVQTGASDAQGLYRLSALPTGRYRLEAKVATSNVVGVKDASGEGAGLRISGGVREGQNAAVGSASWQPVGYTFETPGGDIVIVAELRASKGEVWFARDSLRLVKAK